MHTRERLPATRHGHTHKFVLGTGKGEKDFYIITACYPDGRLGEVFLKADSEGSELGGAYDCFSIALSMLLQSGWTLTQLAVKFRYHNFEPNGRVSNKEIKGFATSPVDYVLHWLQVMYDKYYEENELNKE